MWYWRRTAYDGAIAASPTGFATLNEYLKDAFLDGLADEAVDLVTSLVTSSRATPQRSPTVGGIIWDTYPLSCCSLSHTVWQGLRGRARHVRIPERGPVSLPHSCRTHYQWAESCSTRHGRSQHHPACLRPIVVSIAQPGFCDAITLPSRSLSIQRQASKPRVSTSSRAPSARRHQPFRNCAHGADTRAVDLRPRRDRACARRVAHEASARLPRRPVARCPDAKQEP
jgi:hypothetical protein